MTTIMPTLVTRMDMAILTATDALTTVIAATIRPIAGLMFTAVIRPIAGLITAVIAVTIRGALTPIIGPTFEPPPIIGPRSSRRLSPVQVVSARRQFQETAVPAVSFLLLLGPGMHTINPLNLFDAHGCCSLSSPAQSQWLFSIHSPLFGKVSSERPPPRRSQAKSLQPHSLNTIQARKEL